MRTKNWILLLIRILPHTVQLGCHLLSPVLNDLISYSCPLRGHPSRWPQRAVCDQFNWFILFSDLSLTRLVYHIFHEKIKDVKIFSSFIWYYMYHIMMCFFMSHAVKWFLEFFCLRAVYTDTRAPSHQNLWQLVFFVTLQTVIIMVKL